MLTFIWIIVLMVIALMILGLVSGSQPAKLFVFAVAGFFMVIRAYDVWKTLQDLNGREVKVIEGKGRKRRPSRNGAGRRYRLYIDDSLFYITGREWHHFHDGVRYKVYYTPNTKLIVSVEIMG